MPTEGATNIKELDPNLPTVNGPSGEDYLQLQQLKQVLQASFPELDGLIVNTPGDDTAGNKVTPDAATFSAIFDRLNALETAANPRELGEIVMWSGSIASIPSLWRLCDGNAAGGGDPINGVVVPDLRDRFVVGAGTGYNPGDQGGSAASPIATTSAGAHTHATSAHALTVAELPSALGSALRVALAATTQADDHSDINSCARGSALPSSDENGPMSVVGPNDDAHTHGPTASDGAHTHDVAVTLPPYYAVAYMIYVGVA